MEKILSSEYLIKEAAKGPDIWGASGAYLFSPIVVVCLFFEVDGKGEHLWWFDTFSSSRFHVYLVSSLVENAALSKISQNHPARLFLAWVELK